MALGTCLISTLPLVSCSNDDPVIPEPDTPDVPVIPTPDPEKPSTLKYGMDGTKVYDYLWASISGENAEYGVDGALQASELQDAKDYVWGLYQQAVAKESNQLPRLNAHDGVASWGDVTAPDAVWQMGDNNLDILYASKGTKPEKGYPLYLFIHGSGSDSNEEWNATMTWAYSFKDGPSAFFIPRSPYGGANCRWYQPSRQKVWETMLRQAMLSDEINPEKIYIMGISEGGYGTQRLSSFYADYIAGSGPIATGEQLFNCPVENLANVATCMQTGELDTSYGRAELTRRAGAQLDELAAAHPGYYHHKVNLQAGRGHGCDYTVTTPWLKHASRVLNPKYFYWENLPLGGINGEGYRWRDGFYNLYVLEPSDSREDPMVRSRYEMTIEGNTVDIDVKVVTVSATEWSADAGMNIGCEKSYADPAKGKLRVYLNEELVDLSQPVVVKVNGVEKFNGTVDYNSKHLVESCARYFDPYRVFAAAVDVDVK